jgi:hypothetical protein
MSFVPLKIAHKAKPGCPTLRAAGMLCTLLWVALSLLVPLWSQRIAATLADACTTWRAIYTGARKFADDLMEHIHTENKQLFPLFVSP